MQNIQGKTVLITGASSGIGKAFAYECATKGANLILAARSTDVLNNIATDIRSKYNVQVTVFTADLIQTNAAEKLYNDVTAAGLLIDVLINNAGIGKWGHFLGIDLPFYEETVALNVNSLMRLTYLCLPGMLERKSGGVINVASTGAFQPGPYIAVYCATKAFVISFSEALYGEYRKRGINITALCPGNTPTEFQSKANVDAKGLPYDSPEKVARQGLRAFMRNKSHTVVGIDNWFASMLPGLFPRNWTIRITELVTRRFVQQ